MTWKMRWFPLTPSLYTLASPVNFWRAALMGLSAGLNAAVLEPRDAGQRLAVVPGFCGG